MPIVTNKAPHSASPLWIIALFIGLSEVIAGVAATATGGVSRQVFTWSAVILPLIVFATFVWLLVKYPANLYSPGQYTEGTRIDDYVRAFQSSAQDRDVALRTAIAEVLAEFSDRTEPVGGKSVDQIAAGLMQKLDDVVTDQSILIVVPFPINQHKLIEIPITEETTVSSILNRMYFAISDHVSAFTYGKQWVLVRRPGGEELSEIGTLWAERHGMEMDTRHARDVGLGPGTQLAVKLVGGSEPNSDLPSPASPDHPAINGTAEAAKQLGISPTALRSLITRGILPEPPRARVGQRTLRVFPQEYILQAKSLLGEKRIKPLEC